MNLPRFGAHFDPALDAQLLVTMSNYRELYMILAQCSPHVVSGCWHMPSKRWEPTLALVFVILILRFTALLIVLCCYILLLLVII